MKRGWKSWSWQAGWPRAPKEHIEVARQLEQIWSDRPKSDEHVIPNIFVRSRDGLVVTLGAAPDETGEFYFLEHSRNMTVDELNSLALDARRRVQDRGKAIAQVRSSFRWIGILLPKRIRDEEIGDALEDLHRIINDPNSPNIRRAVRWKIISTWFWLAWRVVTRVSAAIRGRSAS